MLSRINALCACLLLISLGPARAEPQDNSDSLAGEASASAPQSPDTPSVIELPLQGGGVDSVELFKVVADDVHWVAGSVAGFASVLDHEATHDRQLSAESVDGLVRHYPEVFSYRTAASGQPSKLAVDTHALATLLADKKSSLRKWLAGVQKTSLSRLTPVAKTWTTASTSPPRIVVTMAGVHGLETSAEAVALELHRQTNLPMSVFEYPNDEPVAESAERLVFELEKLHRQYPRSHITLVAHSLGGLVSRRALELPDAAAEHVRSSPASRSGVDQLIQVCPPNHGSALSEYAPLLEGLEQASRLVNRGSRKQRNLLRMITDGFNEASADLAPESQLLVELNSGPRNPAIRYTILAGNDGPLMPGMSSLMGTLWDTIAEAVEEPQQLDRRIQNVLNCDELRKGSGDGVVSLQSARLEGVADFEVLPIHHLSWSQLDTPAGKQLISAVVRRLGIAL